MSLIARRHARPCLASPSELARVTFALTLSCLLAAAPMRAQAPSDGSSVPPQAYQATPLGGPYAVETIDGRWTDDARDGRVVPFRAYLPRDLAHRCPLIVFSHGLGGSREGYAYLGEFWASHGLVSLHLQHPGSDDAVWRDTPPLRRRAALQRAANGVNAIARVFDVRFALDTLESEDLNPQSPFFERLDLERIGMAGHSFGAWTTLAVGGQRFVDRFGNAAGLPDPRIDALLPLSAPVPEQAEHFDAAFGAIRIPAMHMTGTLDESPIRHTTADDRRVPFDHTPGPAQGGAAQFLITLRGGDHMVFSGRRGVMRSGQADPELDAAFHDVIRSASLAFWDAYLRDNDEALLWLARLGGPSAHAPADIPTDPENTARPGDTNAGNPESTAFGNSLREYVGHLAVVETKAGPSR